LRLPIIHFAERQYLEYTDLDTWFGQPNPPGFQHVPF
jgi:hypothetical protein